MWHDSNTQSMLHTNMLYSQHRLIIWSVCSFAKIGCGFESRCSQIKNMICMLLNIEYWILNLGTPKLLCSSFLFWYVELFLFRFIHHPVIVLLGGVGGFPEDMVQGSIFQCGEKCVKEVRKYDLLTFLWIFTKFGS